MNLNYYNGVPIESNSKHCICPSFLEESAPASNILIGLVNR